MSDPATPLHLSWDTYSSVYSSSFNSLRKHPKYEDVTLVVDDGHAVAHKILLATCSPLLSSIMELSPNPGVVYLNNISIKNLNLILDFMYTGEANVDNQDLNEFLAAASTLKVMGLTDNSAEMEIVPEDLVKEEEQKVNEDLKVSEDLVTELGESTETPNRRTKRTTSAKNATAKKNTPAKKSTPAKKRKSVEPSSASKHKRKVLGNDVEPDDAAIFGMIRNENEPDTEAEDCVELSPVVPEEEISLNDSDMDGLYPECTIDEITLDDDPDEDHADKIILTKSKEDQAKLKEIFDSFSITKKKGAKNVWECTECNRDFTSKRYVDSHVDFKHTDHVLHKCVECGMMQKSSDGLTRHIGKLHKKK